MTLSHCSRRRNDRSGKGSPDQRRTGYFRFNIICSFAGKRRYQRQASRKTLFPLWYAHGIFTPSDGTRHYIAICRTFCIAAFTATAAGGEEFELRIGQFNVLRIGELHDLIHVPAVSELFLLFIAQPGEDPFQ